MNLKKLFQFKGANTEQKIAKVVIITIATFILTVTLATVLS